MAKAGRKGRVSNELVAASFAAVLAVYGAGYWRTREEAQRFVNETPERRRIPRLPVAVVAVAPPAATSPTASVSVVVDRKPAATQISKGAPPPVYRGTADPASKPAVAAPDEPAPFAYVDKQADSAATQIAAADAPAFRTPPDVTWHDGYYTGWGQSFHGDIEARVTIENGRIVEAGIARCETRYPCSVVDNILYQPVQRQSPDVDSVSRATESSDGYFFGLVQALKKAEAESATPAASP